MRGIKSLGNWTAYVIVGVCLNCMVYCHLVASIGNIYMWMRMFTIIYKFSLNDPKLLPNLSNKN